MNLKFKTQKTKRMKTLLQLVLIIAVSGITSISAQNLMVNGNVESWTAGLPDNWNLAENITQESTTIHEGTYSAKQTSDVTSKKFQQVVTGVQSGTEYTISYWYYDNDVAAKTRIWSYWMNSGVTLADNADELRPATYSEDNASWMQYSVTLTAPAGANEFRFEIRAYQQDGVPGGSVFYDDFIFSGDVTADPEPSNYPSSFLATAAGSSINLSWADATGAQLPSGYIIMAGLNTSLPVPADGTPVLDDLDLSDGNGALNVTYGTQAALFGNLEGNTTYYFTIYPYTNGGANIDYKNDGTAPGANAMTANVTTIEFENFDESWGNWTAVSVLGDQVWDRNNTYGIGSTPCARMSGYSGGAIINEDWLISPGMDLSGYESAILGFFNAKNYDGNDLLLKISTDYTGSGDPNAATWTTESYTLTPGGWAWTYSGDIDLTSYISNSVYVAFYYTCDDVASATWELDDVSITAAGAPTIYPEPTNYPTVFTATEAGAAIDLAWTDATGAQLPSAYIIFASVNTSLPVPTDGTPVANDTDLSDGAGALNVGFGSQQASFSDLDPGTTYYFSIYSYTNNGMYIDFKNDGTAPTANATTAAPTPEPSNYPTAFAATEAGSAIDLEWTDATGAQLPESYIIYASTSSTLPVPVDGTPVADDINLSDGSGALNVTFGTQQATFSNLESATTYYFSIYPYTNSGANINYKNDGTAPAANATTATTGIVVIESENFDESWGGWTPVSVVGDQVWSRENTFGINSTPCASMSGYSGGALDNEDWLISPALNFNDYHNESIEFFNAFNYTGPDLEFLISTDYSGSGDPNAATWTGLSYTLSPGTWTWTSSGIIDLSTYDGNSVHVAFKFTSTTAGSATWEVDDIVISGELGSSIINNESKSGPAVKVYPNPAQDMIYLQQQGMDYTTLSLRSVDGRVVTNLALNTLDSKIDISAIDAGIYFLVFTNKKTGLSRTQKVVVK